MYQMSKTVLPTAEKQESKQTYVQVPIGYSFHELLQQAINSGEVQKQLNSMRPTVSKAESLRRIEEGNASKMPLYMSEAEVQRYTESVVSNLRKIDELKEEAETVRIANDMHNLREQIKAEVQAEHQASINAQNRA